MSGNAFLFCSLMVMACVTECRFWLLPCLLGQLLKVRRLGGSRTSALRGGAVLGPPAAESSPSRGFGWSHG